MAHKHHGSEAGKDYLFFEANQSLLETQDVRLHLRYTDSESAFLHDPQVIHKLNKVLEAQYLFSISHNSLSSVAVFSCRVIDL